MPSSFEFSPPNIFFIHAAGDITLAESLRTIDGIVADARFGPGSVILVDARTVTGSPTTEELRAIAQHMRQFVKGGVVAMALVTPAGLIYGVSRMFSVFAAQIRFDVDAFTNFDEARQWLEERSGQRAGGGDIGE